MRDGEGGWERDEGLGMGWERGWSEEGWGGGTDPEVIS